MMKKDNNINVGLFRVKDDIAPFVEVDYVDKNAQEQTGLMLLDSGSTVNVLSSEMVNDIGMMCRLEGEDSTISSIAEETMNTECVRFFFKLGDSIFSDVFCISNKHLPIDVSGKKVLGIIGVRFMQQFRLVIDYHDFTLHTSMVTPKNLAISDCDYFFPMEIGLQSYSLPVISVKQEGEDLVTLIDTGSTCNMIAEETLLNCKFEHQILEGEDVMIGITGMVDVKKALVRFNVLSLEPNDICEISHYDNFAILPCNVFNPKMDNCDINCKRLPPIVLLIGSSFMAREGWILDFGAKIIYRLKR